MKLKVLVDNNTYIDKYYFGEPGVSYYIENNKDKILFDCGYSSIFIENAKKMNIDLSKVNKIIISHGHNDHTGGLKYLIHLKFANNVELITHPNSLYYKEEEHINIGSRVLKSELEKIWKLNLSKKPVKISNNLYFLGEIPKTNDFEKETIIGKCSIDGKIIDDTIDEDSAIVYKTDKGLFIITGCSHSGICNIIEYSKKVCNEKKIYGVIGGFHLFEKDLQLEKSIEYLKNNNIKLLYPCHCVSLKVKNEMARYIDIQEVGVGLEIDM